MPIEQQRSGSSDRPVIIGFGPAGMFAALELIARGMKPLIFERGKRIEERSRDVQRFITERVLDPTSNIQFGEGGAGSYSDGKLFSRPNNNSPYVTRVFDTFITFGAPEEIAYITKPHLGTDVLCTIVKNIRNYILERGGEICFGSTMTGILSSGGAVRGVVINGEKEYPASGVFLAVGHSSRDTFAMLHAGGIALEQRPISVGARVEHPAGIINHIRYGDPRRGFPGVGAATYSFNYTDRSLKRGVATFCMCPGGEVVNAASENGMIVVNGMSYASRASAFSNAAIVVTCRTDDYPSAHPLAGIEFQKDIERKAFIAGGGAWHVPAQNLMDFLTDTTSATVNENSCKTGTTAADLRAIFPRFVCDMLLTAFKSWQAEYPLFVSRHAVLLAPETRTSCPVKVTRGATFESVSLQGLYPIGEGSGYTGGIISSAADAFKAVESFCAAR